MIVIMIVVVVMSIGVTMAIIIRVMIMMVVMLLTVIMMRFISVPMQMTHLCIHMIIFILKVLRTMWMVMTVGRRPFVKFRTLTVHHCRCAKLVFVRI